MTDKLASGKDAQRFRFRPYRGNLRSAGLSAMSETLLETELRLRALEQGGGRQADAGAAAQAGVRNIPASCLSILKVQAGRPPGNKEVIYDEAGNVVSVVKIPADRLPMHRWAWGLGQGWRSDGSGLVVVRVRVGN